MKRLIVTTDALRVHEQFIENQSAVECHIRVMQTLEMLALVNSLRHLVQSDQGLTALANTAFVMDGQLAAFGTIAVLAQAIRRELKSIQAKLQAFRPDAQLLVISGVKSGAFRPARRRTRPSTCTKSDVSLMTMYGYPAIST